MHLNTPHTVVLLLVGLTALAAPAGAESDAKDATARYDGYQKLLDSEAKKAMARGDFDRARHFYQLLIEMNPEDPHAHREAGRAAHALGEFELAASSFERADELSGGAPDAELHYLHGEALYALGRKEEAREVHERARADIGEPEGRMEILWLARIHARRGELEEAKALYNRLEPLGDKPRDEEVTLSRVEARILNGDWTGAEQILRAFIEWHPKHRRARETLAWVLETRGKVGEETDLREDLAASGPVRAQRIANHGRSLERAYDYDGAIERYREANRLDRDPELEDAIDRLENQISPEVTGGAVLRDDPTGTSYEYRTGVAVPLGARHQLSLVASYETAESSPLPGAPDREANTGTVTGSVLLGRGYDVTGAIQVSANRHAIRVGSDGETRDGYHIGTGFELRTEPGRLFQAQAKAQLNMPWREAASTVREGGRVSGGTGRLYLVPIQDRLIFEAGAQARHVSLAPNAMGEEPDAEQLLLFGGADVLLWTAPEQAAGGQVLDEELLWPAYLADSLVLSYRHYDAFTYGSLGNRVVLADRAQIDELSATARKVLGKDGVLGLELTGGAGYDWARELRLWRVSSALMLSPFPWGRFTVRYDVATESRTGLVGRRHAGWLSLHVDL